MQCFQVECHPSGIRSDVPLKLGLGFIMWKEYWFNRKFAWDHTLGEHHAPKHMVSVYGVTQDVKNDHLAADLYYTCRRKPALRMFIWECVARCVHRPLGGITSNGHLPECVHTRSVVNVMSCEDNRPFRQYRQCFALYVIHRVGKEINVGGFRADLEFPAAVVTAWFPVSLDLANSILR
jgi:hypothetical protein